MLDVSYSAHWFYPQDFALDLLSALVLVAIAIFGFRTYKIATENRKYLLLTCAYLFLAISYFMKIGADYIVDAKHLGLYVDESIVSVSVQSLFSVDAAFYAAFFLFRFCMLYGLFLLYSAYEPQSRMNHVLFALVSVGIVTTSIHSYYVIRTIAFILGLFITYHCWQKYSQKKTSSMRLIVASYGLFTASRLLSLFALASPIVVVVAAALRLLSFAALLLTFILVFYYARRKIS